MFELSPESVKCIAFFNKSFRYSETSSHEEGNKMVILAKPSNLLLVLPFLVIIWVNPLISAKIPRIYTLVGNSRHFLTFMYFCIFFNICHMTFQGRKNWNTCLPSWWTYGLHHRVSLLFLCSPYRATALILNLKCFCDFFLLLLENMMILQRRIQALFWENIVLTSQPCMTMAMSSV